MALIVATFINELNGMTREADDPSDELGKAITNFAGSVTPTVLPAIQKAADQVLLNAFKATNAQNQLPALLPTILTAYAATMAGGMSPTFTGVPPVSPIVVKDIFSTTQEREVFSTIFATRVYTWFLTGTATNTVSGATTTWL